MRRAARKKLEGVKGFIPKPRMLEIAAERTDCLVHAYMQDAPRRHTFEQHVDAIYVLTRSAYMQGVHDTVEVAARNAFEIGNLKPERAWGR